MTRHFLPWSCVLLVLLGALTCSMTTKATTIATCRLLRYGKLTMFSGETANVEIPCNYRMVNMTCGGKQYEVIAGSEQDPEFKNRFSPRAIRVTVSKDNRVINETHNNVWKLRTEAVDATGPTSQTSEVQPTAAGSQFRMADESFMIDLSTGYDDLGVTVWCMAPDFRNEPYPNSLCGDGLTKNVIRDRKDELFSNVLTPDLQEVQNARSTAIIYDVLSQTGFPQCKAADVLRECKINEIYSKKAVAWCAPLWINRTLSRCMLPLHAWDGAIENPIDDGVTVCLNNVCWAGTVCRIFMYRGDFSLECDPVIRDFYSCE